ncbi:MAG: energy transducer TonB [Cyclobacteriaceae bacterium]
MKIITLTLALFISIFIVSAQNLVNQPANYRFQKMKNDFLNDNFSQVGAYYDSILSHKKYATMETYKIANLSYLALSNGSEDSLSMVLKAHSAFQEAVKWYGESFVNEYWESPSIVSAGESQIPEVVDTELDFSGNSLAFYQFISEYMKYPKRAKKEKIEGKVLVQFILTKDGTAEAFNLLEQIGGGCDEEALRIVEKAARKTLLNKDKSTLYRRVVVRIIFKLP